MYRLRNHQPARKGQGRGKKGQETGQRNHTSKAQSPRPSLIWSLQVFLASSPAVPHLTPYMPSKQKCSRLCCSPFLPSFLRFSVPRQPFLPSLISRFPRCSFGVTSSWKPSLLSKPWGCVKYHSYRL